MPKNVAIFGRFCSGKTTLAQELEDEWGFERVSMANNMKQIVSDVYGTNDKSALVTVRKHDGTDAEISVREVLQSFGENAKRHDLYFWMRWFIRDTEAFSHAGIPLVLDDARMTFEADYLRENGWLLVRTEAPEAVRLDRYRRLYGKEPNGSEMSHQTETQSELIDVDLVLDSTEEPWLLAERVIELAGSPFVVDLEGDD